MPVKTHGEQSESLLKNAYAKYGFLRKRWMERFGCCRSV